MKNVSLNNLQKKEISEVLSVFGLNKKDQDVYLNLLRMGQTTLTPLAKLTGLPISTVQSILGRLVDIGIIDSSKRKSRSVYVALDPAVFKNILEHRTKDVSSILPLLNLIKTEDRSTPKIRIYYRERMADIFHQALKSKDKVIYEIVSAKDFQEIIGEKFHFTKKRQQNNVRLNSLRVEAWEIKKYSQQVNDRELRKAKFLPKELNFRSSLMFWDDTIAFFTTKDEGLAWTVESKVLQEMIRQIFEMLWGVSRKMENEKITTLA